MDAVTPNNEATMKCPVRRRKEGMVEDFRSSLTSTGKTTSDISDTLADKFIIKRKKRVNKPIAPKVTGYLAKVSLLNNI